MFVLFCFVYSFAATCCSLPNGDPLETKDELTSTTPEPKNLDDVKEQMKRYYMEIKNKDHQDILREFHGECLFKARDVEKQWTITLDNLNYNLLQERKCRLLFQSMVNISNCIENLFVECWPEWAGYRSPNHYPREYWRILFLNVEHKKILNLKVQLKKLDMSEELFVTTVEDLFQLRIQKANQKINDGDKEEVIKNFNEKNYRDNEPLIIKMLILGLSARTLAAVDKTELKKLQQDVNDITEAQRRSLRVLKFPECKPPVYDDDYFHERLKHAASTITPQAVYVTTQGTYVLYKDFKDALFAFNKRNDMQLVTGHTDDVTIFNATESFIFDEEQIKGCYIVVKIESFSPQNIVETYDIFEQNADSIDKPVAMVIQPAPERNSNADPPKITVFYCYNLEISALLIYEKCKATLKTVDTARKDYNVALTFMALEIIRGMRPFNSEEVDNLKKSFAETEK